MYQVCDLLSTFVASKHVLSKIEAMEYRNDKRIDVFRAANQ